MIRNPASARSSPPRSGRLALRRTALLATAIALVAAVPACGAGTPTADPPPPVAVPAAAPAVAGTAVLDRRDVDAWLDGLLPAALQRTGIAGATVAVVHDGRIVTARGYGYADTGTAADADPVAVDPDRHLFRVGSVAKLVTATAVLQLVQKGDLDLDADVREHLDFVLPRRFDRAVTLRHLLTHTAGFEERIDGLIGLDGGGTDLRRALATDPPEQIYEPGTVPAYSNYSNALAGYVVERVSGMPYEEYVARNVLARAGMASSTFAQPLPAHLADRMSHGYPDASAPAAPFETVGVPPAGALTASAPDMARFMLAHLGEPTGREPLLDRPTLDLMQRPALDATSLGTLADGPRMTLGFFDESRNGHRILGHGGDTTYFHAHLQIYPDDRTGVFVALNSNGRQGMDSIDLREAVMSGFTDRYFPAAGIRSAATVDAATSAAHAATAAGTYESSRTARSTFLTVIGLAGRTTVSVADGGRLRFDPGPLSDSPALYEEVAPWVWREVGGQATVTVRVSDGRVRAIGIDPAITLLPVEPARGHAVVVPVFAASLLVLVVAVLSWPVGAVLRRRLGRAPRPPAGRTARILTRVAVAATVLALVGWAVSMTVIMGLTDVPVGALRTVQALQLIGLLGVAPAAVRLADDVRRSAGRRRTTGSVLVLLALAGVGWFAVEFMLLAPDITY
ncbi:serine hydrolase domain-containing protein [Micromonospora endolithica]|uniref:Class A beta-lactamase-related serine hydrolase n=1 Tax=Micromonospora endolithica TaxID=230091 RepID=A0A3A9ZGV8_9ACTN|nr:serine hydrolase domain-containing protein [Micromonospora endolithica]RKN47772.1 class A beta-lactamase-related serine hydrolase [Micromonospora endolithica]TWJ21449.1 CubicO group peptidase (beta-lactamase class C family) [Micromonospora endolithica]